MYGYNSLKEVSFRALNTLSREETLFKLFYLHFENNNNNNNNNVLYTTKTYLYNFTPSPPLNPIFIK